MSTGASTVAASQRPHREDGTGRLEGGRTVCLAGEEPGLPRVDRPAWGGLACPVSLWAIRDDGTVLLMVASGGQHSGRGETQAVPGEGGEPSRGTRSCTWGAPPLSQPLDSAGTQPQCQSEDRPPRTARALCSQALQSQRCPEEPESELTSLPHTPTPPRAKSSSQREGRKLRAREGHQDGSRETDKTGFGVSPVSSPFNHVQCGLGQVT